MHDSLANHYHLNSILKNEYGYSLQELNTMIPYEREVYVTLLMQQLRDKEEKLKNARN